MDRYCKCAQYWDSVFSTFEIEGIKASTGNDRLDYCLRWAISGANTVVDFGCGNGTLLFIAAKNGTKNHIGIDISHSAISSANAFAKRALDGANDTGKPSFCFMQGGVEKLMCVGTCFCDTFLLSNIIDNLYPDDAKRLLEEVYRVLKPNGRVFVKLNQFIDEEFIDECKIKRIGNNLLDDGLILWNNTTEEWSNLFGEFFEIEQSGEILFPEHDQVNRYFLLIKRK